MPCSIADCTNERFATGLCRRHYYAARAATIAPCSVEGCNKPSWARGWCGTHYRRWKTTGTTADPVRLTDLERYLSKCAPPNANGCRLWTMGCDKDGYGRFQTGGHGKQIHWPAHRFGYIMLVGPIPERMLVCHTCDTPPCQTPEHWRLGTCADNLGEAATRGHMQGRRGTQNHRAKLTDDQVRRIRDLHAKRGVKQAELARMFGVRPSSIYSIVRHKNWAWLD